MLRVFTLGMLAGIACASPALAKGPIMTDIADGGIYCDSFDSNIDGFYALAEKKCKGKSVCVVSATIVATKKDLLAHKCTGFFVAPVCNGVPVNVESRYDVFKVLTVSCKK